MYDFYGSENNLLIRHLSFLCIYNLQTHVEHGSKKAYLFCCLKIENKFFESKGHFQMIRLFRLKNIKTILLLKFFLTNF